MTLTKEQQQWRDRYVRRLVERGGLDEDHALAAFDAVDLDHDFEEAPEDAADEELSNWADDE